MQYKSLLYYLFTFFLVAISTSVFAQNTDSLENEKPKALELFNNKTVTYTIGNSNVIFHVDTLMDGMEIYDPALKANFEYRNNGNVGGAVNRIVFNPFKNFGFNVGYNQFDLYLFKPENVRQYSAKGPFTEMGMQVGQNKEQLFKIRHFQPLGKVGNFNFHLNRVQSDGFYARQKNQQNNVALNVKLGPKSNRYNAQVEMYINGINVQENGGVTSTNIFSADTSFLQKKLVNIQLQDAANSQKARSIFIEQTVNLGKTTTNIIDSVEQKTITPTFSIYHRFGFSKDMYLYSDDDPDSVYYGPLFHFYNFKESRDFEYYTELRQVTNKVGIVHRIVKSADSSKVKYRNYYLELWGEHQIFNLEQDTIKRALEDNFSAGISLRSDPISKSPIIYNIRGKYFFKGYNNNDWEVLANLGYKFGKAGTLGIQFKAQVIEPDWVYTSYFPNWNEFVTDYVNEKTQTTEIGLNYVLPKYRLKTKVSFLAANNFIYWRNAYSPRQLSGLNAVVFEFQKNFRKGGFGNDNFFRLQWLSNKTYMRAPTYFSSHTLFYEHGVIKNRLMVRIGIDVHYSTNYFASAYSPFTGQFYLQDEEQLKFYPVLDVFIATTIKTFRLFIKMDHVNQGMYKENGYYNYYRYPALERSFKVGFSWQFYN